VKVIVNGEPRELPAGATVTDLLADLAVGPGRCAVEINREIVPRSTHGQHQLASDDRIEIVSFVGGG
jgi:sulfur carrier protein